MRITKAIAVSSQETKASWEVINRRVDGLVFGAVLVPGRAAMTQPKGVSDKLVFGNKRGASLTSPKK